MSKIQTATFGAGCFWGVEDILMKQKGVVETRCGYEGGESKDPTYRQVCTGETGHAEVVELKFDADTLPYSKLLELFFRLHDPCTLNSQGPDFGTQYRSVIFFHSPEQEKEAKAVIAKLSAAKVFPNPIVTEVKPAAEFYTAEEYHQKYLEKNEGGHSCHYLRPPLNF